MSDELIPVYRSRDDGLPGDVLWLPVKRAACDLRTRAGWRTLGYCLRRTRPWQPRALGRLVQMAWRDSRGEGR